MARVIVSERADNDLFDIVEYIARHNPVAADELRARIVSACETLATESQAGEFREGFGVSGCRSFSAGNYVLFFSHIKDGIEVSRVIHGSRDLRDFQ